MPEDDFGFLDQYDSIEDPQLKSDSLDMYCLTRADIRSARRGREAAREAAAKPKVTPIEPRITLVTHHWARASRGPTTSKTRPRNRNAPRRTSPRVRFRTGTVIVIIVQR